MSTIDLSTYKALFLETARTYLTSARSMLSVLQQKKLEDSLTELYIAFHSLKSQSSVMGYAHTASFCGVLETFVKSHIDSHTQLDARDEETLRQALVKIEESLMQIERENAEILRRDDVLYLASQLEQTV